MSEKQRTTKKEKLEIRIDGELCKGCDICIYVCPKKVLKISDNPTDKGIHIPEIQKPDECNGCLVCELHCPDFAIYINKKKELTATNDS
ncbi:MAG: 4Fe-4S dicluster domain-containing protein [Candidatus Hodarchaeota archaeon]